MTVKGALMATAALDEILDLNTLEQYCSAIGAGTLLKSVVLFEQLMPEYVGNLVKAKEAGDKDTLCSEAHKFKGAAGSVGLKRIQQYAQLLQHGNDDGWEAGHVEWLDVIATHAFDDLAALKAFLQAKA
ncbi:Hpt domain-containing protein [Shewanella amazonensis]